MIRDFASNRSNLIDADVTLGTSLSAEGHMSVAEDAPAVTSTDDGVTAILPLRHVYGCWQYEWRIPVVGSQALCGYVKRGPSDLGKPFELAPDTCLVCVDLWLGGR